jgi:hypothetical protein
MAPLPADPHSDEFNEVYQIVFGLLMGLTLTGRYETNLIIEATDQAVTDFEDALIHAVSRADGRHV